MTNLTQVRVTSGSTSSLPVRLLLYKRDKKECEISHGYEKLKTGDYMSRKGVVMHNSEGPRWLFGPLRLQNTGWSAE